MSNLEIYPLGETSALQGLRQLSSGPARQTRRDIERLHSAAIIAKLREDGRALLAHTSLEHVGALTALEQHLITVAPLGEARYREIVDSFTLGASASIRRGI